MLEGPSLIRDNQEDMMDQLFGAQLRQSLSTREAGLSYCISIDRQLGDWCDGVVTCDVTLHCVSAAAQSAVKSLTAKFL